jgi:hypothetical protein
VSALLELEGTLGSIGIDGNRDLSGTTIRVYLQTQLSGGLRYIQEPLFPPPSPRPNRRPEMPSALLFRQKFKRCGRVTNHRLDCPSRFLHSN